MNICTHTYIYSQPRTGDIFCPRQSTLLLSENALWLCDYDYIDRPTDRWLRTAESRERRQRATRYVLTDYSLTINHYHVSLYHRDWVRVIHWRKKNTQNHSLSALEINKNNPIKMLYLSNFSVQSLLQEFNLSYLWFLKEYHIQILTFLLCYIL